MEKIKKIATLCIIVIYQKWIINKTILWCRGKGEGRVRREKVK